MRSEESKDYERLKYLTDKQRVAPLDKEERWELEELLRKGCY